MTVNDEFSSELTRRVSILREALARSFGLASSLSFDPESHRHFYLVSLYATVVEVCASISSIVENSSDFVTAILLRSALEAYMDFKNLQTSEDYLEHMFNDRDHQLTRLKEAVNDRLRPDLQEHRRDNERKGMASRKKNDTQTTVKYKWQKAGYAPDYEDIYNHLCCQDHHNLTELDFRYLDPASLDRSTFRLRVNAPPRNDIVFTYLDTATRILASATLEVHEFFVSDSTTAAKELVEWLTKKLGESEDA